MHHPSQTTDVTPAKNGVIYQYRSIVRAGRASLSEWDQTLLGSLPRLALSGGSETFAPLLLELLNPHPGFKSVARVCLIRRFGRSNCIQVLSSENRDELVPNKMKSGYSCFIAANGSMFNLSPGTLRIYVDARHVMDTYKKAGKPPQRSISRIADMGFAGGYFLPSFDQQSTLIGGLFINFDQELGSELSHSQSTVLSLIEAYSRSAILATRASIFDKEFSSEELWQGSNFSSDRLRGCLNELRTKVSWDVGVSDTSFLVSHAALACLLHNLAECTRTNNARITLQQQTGFVVLAVDGLKDLKHAPDQLRLAQTTGLCDVRWKDDTIELMLPFEPACDGLTYSIEHDTAETVALSPSANRSPGIPHVAQPAHVDEDPWNPIRLSLTRVRHGQPVALISVGYAQPDWSDAEWKQVADLSMKAAKRLDISGVVVLHSGIILQILEGASDRMTEFVTTSSEYCRYDQIRSLYLDEIRQRQFKTFQIVAADNDRGISPHQFVSDILGIRTLPDASKAQAWLKIIQKYLGSSV